MTEETKNENITFSREDIYARGWTKGLIKSRLTRLKGSARGQYYPRYSYAEVIAKESLPEIALLLGRNLREKAKAEEKAREVDDYVRDLKDNL